MKILVLSHYGDGMGVSQRLRMEGHDVFMYIRDPDYKDCGRGIVERPGSWRPLVPDVDLIVCDSVGFSPILSVAKRFNKPVFSCSSFTDLMESDRKRAAALFDRLDIRTPDSILFDTAPARLRKDEREQVAAWSQGAFVKPSRGLASETQYAPTVEHLDWLLGYFYCQKHFPLIVQECIDGIEISTEGWFNGTRWLEPFNHTIEEKRLHLCHSSTLGGCLGNIVFPTKGDALTKLLLEPLSPYLRKAGYRGPVDVNAIISGPVESHEYAALEFTCRMGYDAITAFIEGLQEPLGSLLMGVAAGTKESISLGNDYLLAVRLLLDESLPLKGMPLTGVCKENLRHLFLTDAYLDTDSKTFRYAGSDGILACATAHGKTISDARARVYRTISRLSIPNMYYRTDIGQGVSKHIEQLKVWGWL